VDCSVRPATWYVVVNLWSSSSQEAEERERDERCDRSRIEQSLSLGDEKKRCLPLVNSLVWSSSWPYELAANAHGYTDTSNVLKKLCAGIGYLCVYVA
jgi:hypothetical protein